MSAFEKTSGPSSSLAAVFHGPGQALELCKLPVPDPLLPGEALVRVTCCTLCGSDLSTLAGHRQEPTPCILGHEILGRIVALGEPEQSSEEPHTQILVDLRGRKVRVGDRVVWSVAASCGACRRCRRGFPQKCEKLVKYGHHALAPHWQLNGGLSEYCHLVRGSQIVVVEDAISDVVLAPASCATATVAAACRTAGNLPGARVLIFGAGLLGLTACAMARSLGAETVCICDPNPQRLEWAKRFGADHLLGAMNFSGLSNAKYDTIFEMSGSLQAVKDAFSAAEVGAAIVLIGSVRPTPPIEVFPEQMIRHMLSVHGLHNYRPEDLVSAVEFLEKHSHRFPFEAVVSPSVPLEHIQSALLSHADYIRIAVST